MYERGVITLYEAENGPQGRESKENYHHIGELKRIAKSNNWSRQKLKSHRGRLLSMTAEEADKEIQRIRRRETR